jgi:hypothetical protein
MTIVEDSPIRLVVVSQTAWLAVFYGIIALSIAAISIGSRMWAVFIPAAIMAAIGWVVVANATWQ